MLSETASSGATTGAPTWREDVFRILKAAGVKHVAYVPDAGHATAIRLAEADPEIHAVVLTTEEEGIGYLAGAWLGGERGALLMQSSGVGNCINMLGLTAECRFPLLMLVTMRGEWGETNPWQVPMGQNTASSLEGAGTIVHRVDHPGDVASTVAAAVDLAFQSTRAVAVLLGQRLVGAKRFE